MTKDKNEGEKLLINNRKAYHMYEVVETIEAGIELNGCEVKSLRAGGGSVAESYVISRGEQLFVSGMHVQPYKQGNIRNTEPTRLRRLLLHRKQIDHLIGAISAKGMTMVPLRIYITDRGWVKVAVGLCRGKRAPDKREDLKRRTVEREVAREYKLR